MIDNNKAVGPLAAAKMVSLIKAETAKQNKAIEAALDGKAGTAVATASANGLMSAADKVKLDGVETGANKTVVDTELSATSTNPVQNKAIKAYVDEKTHDYYDVTVTSALDAAQTIDGGIVSVHGSADKTFAEIAAAYAAGSTVRCIYGGSILPLVRATDDSFAFRGAGVAAYGLGVGVSGILGIAINSTSSGDVVWVSSAAGELPIPDSDGSQNDRVLVAKDGEWEYSADKLIPATSTSNGLMSAADKAKLDKMGATALPTPTLNPSNVQALVVDKYTTEYKLAVFDELELPGAAESTNAPKTRSVKYALDRKADKSAATQSTDGLMSAADKTKLDGIAAGANKTVVDTELSATSANPVQNKVIKTALDGKAGTAVATPSANGLMSAADKAKLDGVETGANKTVVDAALSATSTNPVQNKAVKAALDKKLNLSGGTVTGNLTLKGAVFSDSGLSFGTGENIHFTKAADDAAKLAHGTAGADDNVPLARLKVAAPTEGDDAATKQYVDAHVPENVQDFLNAPVLTSPVMIRKEGETDSFGVYLSTVGTGEKHAEIMFEDVNENSPVAIANLRTPTGAGTDNYAATKGYVDSKVAEGGAGVTVDAALSATSTNPVQNKAIHAELGKKANTTNPVLKGTVTIADASSTTNVDLSAGEPIEPDTYNAAALELSSGSADGVVIGGLVDIGDAEALGRGDTAVCYTQMKNYVDGKAAGAKMRVSGGYIQYSADSGGTWQNIIAVSELKGAKGETGAAGHSPVVTATKSGGVTTVKVDGKTIATINDGTNGTNGKDGTNGKTPVRGTDYWTAADIATIKGYVDDAILNGSW